MENEVNELVTLPFQQLLEKSKLALDNANGSAPREAGAQSLIKDIERGLRKISPTCKQYLDIYGVNFLNALKENGRHNSRASFVVLACTDAAASLRATPRPPGEAGDGGVGL